MAAFVAITVVLGYVFAFIPNVELVTASIFLSGYLLGSKKGVLIGIVAEFLFSLLNPYGAANPPLLLAQLIAMAIVGYSGGLLAKTTLKTPLN